MSEDEQASFPKSTLLSSPYRSFPETDAISLLDVTFMIASVDLWSADGNTEMNLVLNTSSNQRTMTTKAPSRRKRKTAAKQDSLPVDAVPQDEDVAGSSAYPFPVFSEPTSQHTGHSGDAVPEPEQVSDELTIADCSHPHECRASQACNPLRSTLRKSLRKAMRAFPVPGTVSVCAADSCP
jgi:hypothetical protein